jgi:hypothetical protein
MQTLVVRVMVTLQRRRPHRRCRMRSSRSTWRLPARRRL